MIARILEQQQAICGVLAEDRRHWHCMPSPHDFTTLEAVSSVLQPLQVFTDALSGEKNVTVSAVRPLLKHITEKLLLISSDDCNLVKEIKETIKEDILARYTNEDMVALIDKSTFLDPRFRGRYLDSKEETIARLITEAIEVSEIIRSEPAESANSAHVENPPLQKKSKGLGALLKQLFEEENVEQEALLSLTPREQVDREIKLYLQKPPVDFDSDPLEWWSIQKDELPIIATLAKKYLCVCGTSVPSERLFSKGGHIIGDLRNRLSPSTVNMLIFLAKNLS